MLTGIIYIVGGFIEVVIGLRFIFELLGANPASQFVSFIYSWSTPFVAPFSGIFGQHATVINGAFVTSVFDWTALIALIVYGLILGVITAVVSPRHIVTR
jgi:hypothetical protein